MGRLHTVKMSIAPQWSINSVKFHIKIPGGFIYLSWWVDSKIYDILRT